MAANMLGGLLMGGLGAMAQYKGAQQLGNLAKKIELFHKKEIFLGSFLTLMQEPMIAIFICVFLYSSVMVFSFEAVQIVFLIFIFYKLMAYITILNSSYLKIIRLYKFLKSMLDTIEEAGNNKEMWKGNATKQLKSNITFNNVTFKYTKRSIIQNLSIKLKSKQLTELEKNYFNHLLKGH